MADPSETAAADPAEESAHALRASLSVMDREELVELGVQLLQTYVVEGLGPVGRGGELPAPNSARAVDSVGEETFAGLLRRLKAERRGDPILEKFIVNGEHIQVRTPMGNVDVTEYRRPTAPAPAPVGGGAPRQSVPTPSDSIYNRSLYPQADRGAAQERSRGASEPQPAAAPSRAAPAAPRPAAPPSEPARPGPGPASPAPQKDAKDEPAQDKRFRLIELD